MLSKVEKLGELFRNECSFSRSLLFGLIAKWWLVHTPPTFSVSSRLWKARRELLPSLYTFDAIAQNRSPPRAYTFYVRALRTRKSLYGNAYRQYVSPFLEKSPVSPRGACAPKITPVKHNRAPAPS